MGCVLIKLDYVRLKVTEVGICMRVEEKVMGANILVL